MHSIFATAMRRFSLLLLFVVAIPAQAQSQASGTGGQLSNVRTEYAQVLQVEPVYQTLRAYAIEDRCDPPADAGQGGHCRPTRVEREYWRPVAYDVDYIHRGVKYRSRLPVDPGKRLRVKISVTPDIPPGEKR
jgi:uncharacterized protein YcfJ